MALPISTKLALVAVKSLLKYRLRLDTILSLNEATAGLPFALPPAPQNHAPHIANMLAFFKEDRGQLVLQLKGLQADYDNVTANPHAEALQAPRKRLMELYYEAAEIQPTILGPPEHGDNRKNASRGPSAEMRLAYYVVESQRLSRHSALTRVLFATADTLLEIAGKNAGLFISNSKTRKIVENLLYEFAVKRDFDEDSSEKIFRRLLGVTAVAAREIPGLIPERPALNILFAALNDVRKELGDDFVARLIWLDGFEKLAWTYLIHVAADPSFVTKHDLAQKVLTATLAEVGQNFKTLLDDPQAFVGVFEVWLFTAAANVDGLLSRALEDKPLPAAALTELAHEVTRRGQQNILFHRLAHGEVIAALYQTVLNVIAANPDRLANVLSAKKLIAEMVAGLAEALSPPEVVRVFTAETLHYFAVKSLEIFSTQPAFLAENLGFAAKLSGAVLRAGAESAKDGINSDHLLNIVAAAIKAAVDNLALVAGEETLSAALVAAGKILAAENLKKILAPEHRKEVLLAIIKAVAANPRVWNDLQQANLVQPVMAKIFEGLSADATGLLSGVVLVDSIQKILIAVVRRGKQLIARHVEAETLRTLLALALEAANREIGISVDGKNLPEFLERVVAGYLKSPFPLPDLDDKKFSQLASGVLNDLENK